MTKEKEKLLNEACEKHPVVGKGLVMTLPAEALESAMDEYSSIVAIGFLEWVDGEMYECYLTTDEGVKYWQLTWKSGPSYTTKELYQLWMSQQK